MYLQRGKCAYASAFAYMFVGIQAVVAGCAEQQTRSAQSVAAGSTHSKRVFRVRIIPSAEDTEAIVGIWNQNIGNRFRPLQHTCTHTFAVTRTYLYSAYIVHAHTHHEYLCSDVHVDVRVQSAMQDETKSSASFVST